VGVRWGGGGGGRGKEGGGGGGGGGGGKDDRSYKQLLRSGGQPDLPASTLPIYSLLSGPSKQ